MQRTFHPWATCAAAILIVAAGAAAYSNSFTVPFVYDDVLNISSNPHILHLWPIWEPMQAPPTLSCRPLLGLSFAINYAAGGFNVAGYHAVNLLVHLLAALALFGVVRRTLAGLSGGPSREALAGAATPLALVSALIWMVHPLQTESVTYIVQRAESIMGLFYLLALYCAIRGFESGSRRWFAASVAFCALGMGTKEVMVTAPLIVLLYDRTFVSGTFGAAFRQRWGLYAALASTWIVILLMAALGPAIRSAGSALAIAPLEYARAEVPAILHYLLLTFRPWPLVFDYGTPMPGTFAEIAPQAVLLVLILAAVVAAAVRRPRWGFAGAWFFLVLAPSSSFFPIADTIVEHRMYLPLAGVVALVVVTAYILGSRLLGSLSSPSVRARAGWSLGLGLSAAVIIALACMTVERNRDYRSSLSLWQDTVEKCGSNPRARENFGSELAAERRFEEAYAQFSEALRLSPEMTRIRSNVHYDWGRALVVEGNRREARPHLLEAVRIRPDFAEAHFALAILDETENDVVSAIAELRETLRCSPDQSMALNELAWLLSTRPESRVRNGAEAVRLAERARDLTMGINPYVLDTLAAAYAEAGRLGEAAKTAEKALEVAASIGDNGLVGVIRSHLDAYRQGRPWTEMPAPGTRGVKP